MIFSHISDTHLGLVQYGSEEREQDLYDAFNQSIDVSVKDHVEFVIFAGDIFHVPNPSGTAVIQMANALKKLRENNIESFFVLGEHDISRIKTTPIPYVYHNLGFSRYIGRGNPTNFKDILIVGLDKIRKSEMPGYDQKFREIERDASSHHGHKIMVMHQGITEFNKFAGELLSTEMPKHFTYYAMGHLHDNQMKQFSHLEGPIVYPGSIEMTTSEGIKETEKGFYEVDISTKEARPNWVKLDTRLQLSFKTGYFELQKTINEISEKIAGHDRKPVVEINIHGENIESDVIQTQISRLNTLTLRCFWKIISKESLDSKILVERPRSIDDELFRLAVESLGSEKDASFAIRELLPLLTSGQTKEAAQIVVERYQDFKREKSL